MMDLTDEKSLSTCKQFILSTLPEGAPKEELAEFVITLIKEDKTDGAELEKECMKQLKDFLGKDTPDFVADLIKFLKQHAPKEEQQQPTEKRYQQDSNRAHYETKREDHRSGNHREEYRDDKRPARRDKRDERQNNRSRRPKTKDNWEDRRSPRNRNSQRNQRTQYPKNKNFCNDYIETGFCPRGANCPYFHSGEVMPQDPMPIFAQVNPHFYNLPPQTNLYPVPPFGMEGDLQHPALPSLPVQNMIDLVDNNLDFSARNLHGRKKIKTQTQKIQNKKYFKAFFVDNIPKELNDIAKISQHFGKFGKITNIKVMENVRKCIVEYGSHLEALEAYRSYEPILGNRFIKLHWPKDNELGQINSPIDFSFVPPNKAKFSENLREISKKSEPPSYFPSDDVNNNLQSNVPNLINFPQISSTDLTKLDPYLGKSQDDLQELPQDNVHKKMQEFNKKRMELLSDLLLKAEAEKDPKKKDFYKQQAKDLLATLSNDKKGVKETEIQSSDNKRSLASSGDSVIDNTRPSKRRMQLDNRPAIIKIENLPSGLSHKGSLFKHFKNYGIIQNIWIEGTEGKLDGFVQFAARAAAEYAFMHGTFSIYGDQLQFSWAEQPDNPNENKETSSISSDNKIEISDKIQNEPQIENVVGEEHKENAGIEAKDESNKIDVIHVAHNSNSHEDDSVEDLKEKGSWKR